MPETNFQHYQKDPSAAWRAFKIEGGDQLITEIDTAASARCGCEIERFVPEAGFAFWLQMPYKGESK